MADCSVGIDEKLPRDSVSLADHASENGSARAFRDHALGGDENTAPRAVG